MIFIWCFGIFLSSSLQGFCNGREIFVSPLGRNNNNCTSMDNPCLTIQYAIDNVAISNDVIKIDGSLGSFIIKNGVRISKCMILTFTSYNGVAWIVAGYNRFLEVHCYKRFEKCKIIVNTVNFFDTTLFKSRNKTNIRLTVRNCYFEFYWPRPYLYPALISMRGQYSFITMENCTIKGKYKIGLIAYQPEPKCNHLPSRRIKLKNTRIHDALYIVATWIQACTRTTYKRTFKLAIINSEIQSKGNDQPYNSQVLLSTSGGHLRKFWLSVYLANSRFENISVLGFKAAVMDIRVPDSSVSIRNCTFKGNSGSRGGALSLESKFVSISDSQFYDNNARIYSICARRAQEGCGGAIFADGFGSPERIKIYNSSFVNNIATCSGSSVYLGRFNTIIVNQTQFSTRFTRSSDTIWVSFSNNLQIDKVLFQARKGSSVDGGLFFARSKNFTFGERAPYFKSPVGSKINISESKAGILGKSKTAKVQYCPKGTYTLTPGTMFGFNDTIDKQQGLQSQCQSCSFGAVCHRGIKPMPNFWGYTHQNKAFMVVCPPGYCCQTPNQCIDLNSCNNKRTGQLCGKCRHGYFQSVFRTECLEDNVCKAAKFWALAIMICLLFTIIFIFLQDIFLIVVKSLSIEKLVSVIKRRADCLSEIQSLMEKHLYQPGQSSGNERGSLDPINDESNADREDEEVERHDEAKVDTGRSVSNSNSTAGGLIKIVFFFYQIHSILTVYKSNREIQYLRELKEFIPSIFNLNVQVHVGSEFHCPFHGIGSTGKTLVKALFPVNCLILAALLYMCIYAVSYCFSSNGYIQKGSMKVKPRLLTAILQLILLGYSALTSSILSLLTCLSLITGERILYIDGNVPCYQTWQYAIMMFIVLWAIPLIYALHKLPSYMRNVEISIGGVYIALLLPLPFAVYTMARKVRCVKVTERSNDEYSLALIPYVQMQQTNAMMTPLLNVIEGPFRCKTTEEKAEKLPWEPILLLQRLLLSLCHTFVLEPGMRSLLLLLIIIIFLYVNVLYRPFGNGFLNIANEASFIFLCITGIINAIHAFIYEYGSIPKGPLVHLLNIFDYLDVIMVMIFPVIAVGTLAMVALTKFLIFCCSMVRFIIASCKCCKSHDD